MIYSFKYEEKILYFYLIKNSLSYHENWEKAWKDPEPKKEYDIVIIGGGGHGLATAYYLAKKHNLNNIAVVEKVGSVVETLEEIQQSLDQIIYGMLVRYVRSC